MDNKRLILLVVFSLSLFMLWDAWQKYTHPPVPVASQAATPAATASVPTPELSPAPAGAQLRTDNLRDLEREHILETLAAVGGSRKLAGERLGMSERTLRHKLKQYREAGFLAG